MAMSRKHRHSSRRNPVFPQLPVVVIPTCGACDDGYLGCHPGRQCFTPAEITLHRDLAALESRVHDITLGIECRTVRTELDLSFSRLRLSSRVTGDVMGRDPKERDFSPTALWTPREDMPVHLPIQGCLCIECRLDANTMPLWVREMLSSQADTTQTGS